MKRTIPFFIAVVIAVSSCGDKSKQTENATSENCLLALVDTSVVVKWTAYKTTEKIGVSGTFDIVQVSDANKAETALEVLKNASFEIPVTSVNSGLPDRDGKIFGHFFSSMLNTGLLAGQVLEAGPEQWKVGLVMNDVRDTLIFNFTESEGNVSLVGTLDLAKWNALASADSLNKVCYDLHKGADGVSKLWPDVKLEISANLKEDCN
ncbi:MAG: hypothetical protein H6603_11480 [Flavobacteriales bacterium]|nr:hypothetical protein [Flavobacteriales bacterium]MCB9205590.1 hypothetical protein [Flavobacteriales bacterium]